MAVYFNVELTEPETSFTVEVDGRDIRRWESEYEESFTATVSSATQTAQLAHIAALRHGLFEAPWAVFDMRCTAVTATKGVDLLSDPTRPAAMADSS